jgi:predicted phage terminase large subunit-like protein
VVPKRVVVEDVAYQRAFIDHAQERGLPVIGVKPRGSKEARAIPAATRMEAGQVFFPAEAKWLDDLEHELLSFPNGRHDDMVDVLAYAVAELRRRKPRQRLRSGSLTDSDLGKGGVAKVFSYG